MLTIENETFIWYVLCNDIYQNNSFLSCVDELFQHNITFLVVAFRLSDAILMLVQA